MSIRNRKKDHINLTIYGDAEYAHSAGFDRFRLRHCSVPELNLADIDTSVTLLGRKFSMPLFISSMTGGNSEMGQVNRIIAEVCQEMDIPMGVGSQRIMLEDAASIPSFSIVREAAPDAFIAANIGGAQIRNRIESSQLTLLIDSIRADAVIVHLNVLQELMQPEGDREFKGILSGIRYLVEHAGVPVIVKETGAGISGGDTKKIYDTGVRCIDIAGSGGTSWAKVENLRKPHGSGHFLFDEWGLPTVQCLEEINALNLDGLEIIASGGIRTPFDVLKSHALGAGICAIAQPVIKVIHEEGKPGLVRMIEHWREDIRMGLLLMGVKSPGELNHSYLDRV